MQQAQRPKRPRLTLKILPYAVLDVAGMILFATGALWLAQGQSLFSTVFPTSMAEAIAALVVGVLFMLWAAARILQELLGRPAE